MIGRTIGQYEIQDLIGEGGMARVYRAYQPSAERYVAIKVLPSHLSEDPSFLKRFQHEARVIARLEHRSILPVYDYGEHDGMPYIVMRQLEGGTLRARMRGGRLPADLLVKIVLQISEALDYAHSRGVIHRDLKPSNILLDDRDNAYLTDFGIARIIGDAHRTTGEGVVGTPTYMSPEQCQGKDLTHASDLYSLGILTFDLLAGRPPFRADAPLTVMYMHVKDSLPSVLPIERTLPPEVDRVLARMTAKIPDRRYRTAGAFAEELARTLRGWHREGDAPVLPGYPVQAQAMQGKAVHASPPPRRPAPDMAMNTVEIERQARFNRIISSLIGVAILLGAVGIALALVTFAGDGRERRPEVPTLPPSDNVGLEELLGTPAIMMGDTSATPADTDGVPNPTATTPTGNVDPGSLATLTPAPTVAALDPTALFPTPTYSPTPVFVDGSLVFTQGIGDGSEIVVVDANGRDYRQLTNNTWYDGEPDWSPDGLRIAYESAPDGQRDIWIINANGGNATQITDTAGDELHPHWSPDGQYIAFEAGDGNDTEIYVMTASGNERVQLTNNNAGDRAPQFSPDGSAITYMTDERGVWEIAVMAYPSGDRADIYDCPAPDCRFPAWSPDGLRIAFNTLNGAGRVADIWAVNVSTGQSNPIIQGGQNGRPTWSGNGGYIFFNRTDNDNTDIYRANVTTRAIERLTANTGRDYASDWGSNAP